MKKALLLAVLFVVTLLPSHVLAGDIPESLMLGDQKAIFIGEIMALTDTKCDIKAHTLLMGTLNEEETLTVKPIKNYYGTTSIPQKGDIIVAVLLDDNQLDTSWLFKATSTDYTELTLVGDYDEDSMPERYQKYIRKGAYQKAQEKLNIQLVPTTVEEHAETLSGEAPTAVLTELSSTDSLQDKYDDMTGRNEGHRQLALGIFFIIGLFCLLIVRFYYKKKSR